MLDPGGEARRYKATCPCGDSSRPLGVAGTVAFEPPGHLSVAGIDEGDPVLFHMIENKI